MEDPKNSRADDSAPGGYLAEQQGWDDAPIVRARIEIPRSAAWFCIIVAVTFAVIGLLQLREMRESNRLARALPAQTAMAPGAGSDAARPLLP